MKAKHWCCLVFFFLVVISVEKKVPDPVISAYAFHEEEDGSVLITYGFIIIGGEWCVRLYYVYTYNLT